jgi:malonyl-CoA O-methyltransferase
VISAPKIKDNFSRAAHTYEKCADIQYSLAKSLLRKLRQEKIWPEKILDIGCGTGKFLADLRGLFPYAQVMGLDISPEMVRIAKGRCPACLTADAQALPFKNETFDLIISNAVYQWVKNLNCAFEEAYRALKNKGVFIFSCFGRNTLKELRECFNIEENGFLARDTLYTALRQSGFSDISIKEDMQRKYFDNLSGILYWLKDVGGNRFYSRPYFLTPGKLEMLSDIYADKYRCNAKVYAGFEVFKVRVNKPR